VLLYSAYLSSPVTFQRTEALPVKFDVTWKVSLLRPAATDIETTLRFVALQVGTAAAISTRVLPENRSKVGAWRTDVVELHGPVAFLGATAHNVADLYGAVSFSAGAGGNPATAGGAESKTKMPTTNRPEKTLPSVTNVRAISQSLRERGLPLNRLAAPPVGCGPIPGEGVTCASRALGKEERDCFSKLRA
jgi:hypothetical protein